MVFIYNAKNGETRLMMKRREKNLLLILHAEESAVVGVGGTKLLWVTDDLSQKKE